MKVLTISATDKIGGAGIASYRLHQALLRSGLAAEMLVWRKVTADPTVHRLAGRLNRWQRARRRLAERRHRLALDKHARKAGSAYWSLNHRSYPVSAAINSFAADLVHLHWIGDNFLPIAEFAKIKAPIVWTLHDMWAFTGGCHYAGTCTNTAMLVAIVRNWQSQDPMTSAQALSEKSKTIGHNFLSPLCAQVSGWRIVPVKVPY